MEGCFRYIRARQKPGDARPGRIAVRPSTSVPIPLRLGATASYRSLPAPTSRTLSGPMTRRAATGCEAEMLRANRSSWSSLGRSGSSARGGDHARSSKCRALGEGHRLPTHAKARAFLENFAKRRIPITYQALANALQILRPHSIHQVTEALERLMEEDAAADRPFIAALAIRGAWRPTRARVLRLRPTSRPVRGRSGRSGRMVVSRCRAKRRLRSLGRSARQLTATI